MSSMLHSWWVYDVSMLVYDSIFSFCNKPTNLVCLYLYRDICFLYTNA